ncbi:putative mitochondrial protein, partial [Mucuna pruriens]
MYHPDDRKQCCRLNVVRKKRRWRNASLHLDALKLEKSTMLKVKKLKMDGEKEKTKVELKQFPSHLIYIFLEGDDDKLVIISISLSSLEEEKLVKVLWENKGAIWWSIFDPIYPTITIITIIVIIIIITIIVIVVVVVIGDPYFFKVGLNNLLRRCVNHEEEKNMWHCYNSPYGGHYNGERTTAKLFQSSFFWPTLFKDSHNHAQCCDKCQRTGSIYERYEIPLQNILKVEAFDYWGINFVVFEGKGCHNNKLDNTLWTYHTTFKTPLGLLTFKMIN